LVVEDVGIGVDLCRGTADNSNTANTPPTDSATFSRGPRRMTPQDPRRESVRETRRHFPGDPGRPVVADAGAARAHPRIPQTAFRPASGQRLTPPLRGAAGRRVPGLAKGREPGALGRRGGEFPRAVPRLGRKGSPRTLSRVGCLAGGPGDAGGRRARPRFRPRHPLRRGCWGQNHSPGHCRGGLPERDSASL
jgi:hypothetical protein